jgi:thiamine biosynthesis lipoprotein
MNSELAKLKRRDLLRLACLAGLGLAIPLFKWSAIDNSLGSRRSFRLSTRALGTTVSIRVEEDLSPVRAHAAINDAFDEIRRLEAQLTRFEPHSQVYHLNQLGKVTAPAQALLELLDKSRCFYERSEGAFDITVKPALDLFQNRLDSAFLPSDADFEVARSLIDFEQLSFSKDYVSFAKLGMGITLDCIAKGYALDRAAARMKSHGVSSALIQGGGTLVAIGSRSDGSPWRIGIRDPLDPNALIGTIGLANAAVATSGDYEDFFSADGRFYHIVDPASARSPLYSHSATVTAPTAGEADPLGVTLMVKDSREGLRLLEDFKGCECLITRRGGGLVRSSGFGVLS